MPARIGPPSMTPDEDFARPARIKGTLSICVRLNNVFAPDDGNVAEVLNFSAGKFQAYEFSAGRVKLSRGLKNLILFFPIAFSGTNDEGVLGYQLFQSLHVVGKPGTPDGLSCFQ